MSERNARLLRRWMKSYGLDDAQVTEVRKLFESPDPKIRRKTREGLIHLVSNGQEKYRLTKMHKRSILKSLRGPQVVVRQW